MRTLRPLLTLVFGAGCFLLLLRVNLAYSAANPMPGSGPYGHGGKWELVFSDEFEGSIIDPNRWVPCYWWDNQGCTNLGNNEEQWYLPENVSVANGILSLTAKREQAQTPDGDTYSYTSGMVTSGRLTYNTDSPSRFAYKYGYAEVRARIPKGKGLWPAIWLLPDDHIAKPEIDVMEILGDDPHTVYMNFHYKDQNGNRARSAGQWTSDVDLSEDWHIYAVDWKPNELVWYIDGIERRRFTKLPYIPNEPMYLILNLAVGGDWPGSPDDQTVFPSSFEIDYVRVWKRGADITLHPVGDTYVDEDHKQANFNGSPSLVVDGNPIRIAYLKYDLSMLRGRRIKDVWLRLKIASSINAGSANSQYVYLVSSNDWNEQHLTYHTRPDHHATPLGILADTQSNIIYDIPLDEGVFRNHTENLITLAIASKDYDGIYFYSREYPEMQPRLFIFLEEKPPVRLPFLWTGFMK